MIGALIAGLTALLATLIVLLVILLANDHTITLKCDHEKPKVEQIGTQGNGYTKVTCP